MHVYVAVLLKKRRFNFVGCGTCNDNKSVLVLIVRKQQIQGNKNKEKTF